MSSIKTRIANAKKAIVSPDNIVLVAMKSSELDVIIDFMDCGDFVNSKHQDALRTLIHAKKMMSK